MSDLFPQRTTLKNLALATSSIAALISAAYPLRSQAEIVTIKTVVDAGWTIVDPDGLSVTSSGAISPSTGVALNLKTSGQIVNAGLIAAQDAHAIAVSDVGVKLTNAASGQIRSAAGNAIRIASGLAASTIGNGGKITATGSGAAIYTGSAVSITNAAAAQISAAVGNAIHIASGLSASTIANSGTISSAGAGAAIFAAAPVSISNAASGQISSANGNAIHIASGVSASSISNSGKIAAGGTGAGIVAAAQTNIANSTTGQITSALGHAIQITTGGSASTIANSGKIAAAAAGSGIYAEAQASITNNASGQITSAAGHAIQIATGVAASTISNSGKIAAAGTGAGISAASPVTITNNASGQITSAAGHAIRIATGVSAATINNSGKIAAAGTGAGISAASAVNITNNTLGQITSVLGHAIHITTGGSTSTISNSGKIAAAGTGSGIYAAAPVAITNNTSGQIASAAGHAIHIATGVSAATINNSGKISAAGTGSAIMAAAPVSLTNATTGQLASVNGNTLHIGSGGAGSLVNNSGKITAAGTGAAIFANAAATITNNLGAQIASANGNAIRIASNVSASTITNRGNILTKGAPAAISAMSPAAIVNHTTGVITSSTGAAIELGETAATSEIQNRGKISAIGTGLGGAPAISSSVAANVTNYAGASILSSGASALHFRGDTGLSSVDNGGTIQGGINTGAGIAIQNTGNGALNISNSGKIIGQIMFGNAGADQLIVTGGSILGAIKGAGGNDTISYNLASPSATFSAGAISDVASLSVNSGSVLFGGATSGIQQVNIGASGRAILKSNLGAALVTNDGTLQLTGNYAIAGNYAQGPTGILQVDVGQAAGRLSVSGNADIASDSAIYVNNTRALKVGEKFTVLSAGSAPSLAAAASSLHLSNNAFVTLTPSVNQSTLTELILTVAPTTTSMTAARLVSNLGAASANGGGAQGGANNLAVLNSLVSVVSDLGASQNPASAAEFQSLSTSLSNLKGEALASAVQQVQANPGLVNGTAAASLHAGNNNIDTISDRLARARVNYYPGASGAKSARPGLADEPREGSVHVWGQGLANRLNQSGRSGEGRETGGVIMGSDVQLANQTRVGGALGLSQTSISAPQGAANSSRLQSYQGTLYASKGFGAAYVEGQVGYAYNDTRTTRAIDFMGRVANASFGGKQKLVRLGSGYTVEDGGLLLTPNAFVQYAHLSNAGYAETDAGALNLVVAGNSAQQTQGALGVRAAYPVVTSTGFFAPELRLNLLRNMSNRAPTTTAWLADGGSAFSATGVIADRYAVNVGLYMTLAAKDRLTFLMSGDYVRSATSKGYSTMFKLNLRF
jgi:uncharacterized protein with beta-barrel porin domain